MLEMELAYQESPLISPSSSTQVKKELHVAHKQEIPAMTDLLHLQLGGLTQLCQQPSHVGTKLSAYF